MTLRDAIDDYLYEARRLSPDTARWYEQKLRAFGDWCETETVPPLTTLEEVDGRVVRRYMDGLRASTDPRKGTPLSTYTQHGYAQVLKQFLRWCGREGYCAKDLYERVRMPRRDQHIIRTLTPRHIEALYDACREEAFPVLVVRDQAILSVMLATGVRASELTGLTLEQVHLDRDDPHLRVYGKGMKWRSVGLGDRATHDLRRYLRVRRGRSSEPHVFLNQKGQGMTPAGLDQMLYRLRDWAGAERFEGIRVSAHTLRHTFAKMTMELPGSDVFKLKELMGHSAIQTTLGYLKDFEQRAARRGPNPLDEMDRQRRAR